MDQSGNDVFSRSALTRDQHRNIRCGDFAQPRTNRLHCLRVPKNDVVRGTSPSDCARGDTERVVIRVNAPFRRVFIRMH